MIKYIREIPGIFTGESMETEDGTIITVPENYASKSMLVMGDELIYRITEGGQTFFKQSKKVPSKKVVAKIITDYDEELKAKAIVNGKYENFRMLVATQSFHRLKEGDEVIIIIPETLPKLAEKWAAVETKIG